MLIRQKIGVGPEFYVDSERAGGYRPGETYEIDEAKGAALKATGKYEDHDPATPPSVWDGTVPEPPRGDIVFVLDPKAPASPPAPATPPATHRAGDRRRSR